jgi:hypothetical protein
MNESAGGPGRHSKGDSVTSHFKTFHTTTRLTYANNAWAISVAILERPEKIERIRLRED